MTHRRFWRLPWLALGAHLLGCDAVPGPTLPDHGPPPALSGALLSFDSAAAAGANAAQLPPGFTAPQPTVCGPDPTLGFLSELQDGGVDQARVPYEWAPIVAGPDSAHPTVGQPEFFVSGSVKDSNLSTLDFRPAHPFGFDSNWDLVVDPPFHGLVHNRPEDGDDSIHCEIEQGLYPADALGLAPIAGDRVLLRGAWIFDCGHPPYEAELHPPTFLALARTEGSATVSLAFANPYRVTQLYGAKGLVTAFGRPRRFQDASVAPFTTALKNELVDAALTGADHLEMRALLEATAFPPLTWFVCAPGPRPSEAATLGYSYQLVARTGVTLTAALRGASGCLELHAELGPDYQPAVPPVVDQAWPWAQISSEASSQVGSTVDVRQLIVQALAQQGFTNPPPAVQPDHAPVLGTFAPLSPRAGAAQDSPTAIVTGADDQPLPFYGRVRVFWKQ